jgi:dTMP kinase
MIEEDAKVDAKHVLQPGRVQAIKRWHEKDGIGDPGSTEPAPTRHKPYGDQDMVGSSSLGRSSLRRLVTAQVISSIGDWLATFAMMALVLSISGSTAAVGGILVLRLSPALLAGPVMSRVVGRWNARTIMLRADLVRAAIAVVLPLVSELWWVYVWAVMLELVTLVAVAARDGSVARVVEVDDLPLANGLLMGSTYGSLPVGAALFTAIGVLVAGSGRFLVAFGFDALTFLTSYLIVSRIAKLRTPPISPGTTGAVLSFRDALAIPVVRSTIGPLTVASTGIGTLFSLGIVFVRDTLGAREEQFGILVVVFGIGALLGLGIRQSHPPVGGGLWAVRVGVLTMGGVLMAMSLMPSVGPAFAAALTFGAAAAYAIVSGITGLQTLVAEQQRILALGVFHVAIRLALGVGAVGAGLAADLVGTVAWPVVGRIDGIRAVMFVSGIVAVAGALATRAKPAA